MPLVNCQQRRLNVETILDRSAGIRAYNSPPLSSYSRMSHMPLKSYMRLEIPNTNFRPTLREMERVPDF